MWLFVSFGTPGSLMGNRLSCIVRCLWMRLVINPIPISQVINSQAIT